MCMGMRERARGWRTCNWKSAATGELGLTPRIIHVYNPVQAHNQVSYIVVVYYTVLYYIYYSYVPEQVFAQCTAA